MFTRIEIDGFKSFQGLKLDLEPFSVIAGPNAAGKSNFFDALRLLSRLAETDARTALQDLRGEPHELFRQQPDGLPSTRMRFALEVLLDRDFTDPYGERHELKNTRVRYEVGIERRSEGAGALERIFVFHEQAFLIQRDDDNIFKRYRKDHLRQWAPAKKNKRSLISMTPDDRSIEVTQDGSAGRRRTLPMGEATATFLSSLRTGGEFQHLYALRKELASLRFLQLNPAAERIPSDMLARDELDPDGANLATVLARMKAETATNDQPHGVMIDIRRDLTNLIPGILEIDVERNEAARQFQLTATMRDGSRFGSRVLSDGTLRVIALLAVLHDPRRRGVLCFEEPENGIHEARVPGLINLLRSACTDLNIAPEAGEFLTQIIVNTHSPLVLKQLEVSEIIGADAVLSIDPTTKTSSRKTRMRRGADDGLPLGDRDSMMTRYETEQLLKREPEEAT